MKGAVANRLNCSPSSRQLKKYKFFLRKLHLLEQNIAQQKLCLISKDGDRFLEIDNEFHRLIFECAGKIK